MRVSGEGYEQKEEAEEDMVEISHLQQRRKEGMKDTPTARIQPKEDRTSSSTTQLLSALTTIQETSHKLSTHGT